MSAVPSWLCFLLWIRFSAQHRTPDVVVTCVVSEECLLPCSFPPASRETIQWFRQDVAVFKFQRRDDDDDNGGGDTEEEEEEDEDEREDKDQRGQLAGRGSVLPQLVTHGNATLVLRDTGLKDRGTYKCQVTTSVGKHNARVILKVKAPIQAVFLELSRLSGYEEMKCSVRGVFPAPRVSWETVPPTLQDLRPVTRIMADRHGLYTLDSRLRRLSGQPELIYVCRVSAPYGGAEWTSSLRVREMRGSEGRDVTLPCFTPASLNKPLLHWSFSGGEEPFRILTYDAQSGLSAVPPPWDAHLELDAFRVPFGDGSLRLMDPRGAEHSGSYSCVFAAPRYTHTERTDLTVDDAGADRSSGDKPSYWWVGGLGMAVLVLGLVGVLAYLKSRGIRSKARKDPEDLTELHLVKDSTADGQLQECSPLTVGGANGQSETQAGTQLT
ncbi:advanced glycosylation end product-specific receptor-like [Nelusetta ayraudi]|uniref:advanced glycosylation end product-specific receptor-like n=1 Tax=Nelusetta ayraudi TaxID=303726 RepID=UPI003F6F04B2